MHTNTDKHVSTITKAQTCKYINKSKQTNKITYRKTHEHLQTHATDKHTYAITKPQTRKYANTNLDHLLYTIPTPKTNIKQ